MITLTRSEPAKNHDRDSTGRIPGGETAASIRADGVATLEGGGKAKPPGVWCLYNRFVTGWQMAHRTDEQEPPRGGNMAADPSIRSKLGTVIRVTSGNFLEMFDFFLFGFNASYIAETFFPSDSEFASLIGMTYCMNQP